MKRKAKDDPEDVVVKDEQSSDSAGTPLPGNDNGYKRARIMEALPSVPSLAAARTDQPVPANTLDTVRVPEAGSQWYGRFILPSVYFTTNAYAEARFETVLPQRGKHKILAMKGLRETTIGGKWVLGSHQCVAFDETCQDLELEGMTIRGGTIVFYGSTCRVCLTNTTLINCTVLASAGAHVRLDSCTMRNEPPQASAASPVPVSRVALLADGRQAVIAMFGGSIVGYTMSGLAREGGVLAVNALTKAEGGGFYATGTESFLNLFNFTLQAQECASSFKSPKTGVQIWQNCNGEVVDVHIERFSRGIKICSRGSATLVRCSVRDIEREGVVVSRHSTMQMVDCTASAVKGHGVAVYGEGSAADISRFSINQCEASGCEAWDGAQVSIKGSTFSACCQGLRVHQHATVRGDDVSITGCKHHGIQCGKASHATLKACTVEGCGRSGFLVEGLGTTLTVDGGAVRNSGFRNVEVRDSANAELKDVSSSGAELAGFECCGLLSSLMLNSCQSWDCHPYFRLDDGRIFLHECAPGEERL